MPSVINTACWIGILGCAACGGKTLDSNGSLGTTAVGGAAQGSAGGTSSVGSGARSNGGATQGGAAQGGSAEGGAIGLSGAAGIGGVGGGGCPAPRPLNFTACTPAGLQCNYGGNVCAPDAITCQGGVWTPNPPLETPRISCDVFAANLPSDGQSCACLGTLRCSFDDCRARGRISANCDNTSWRVTTEPCPLVECGPPGNPANAHCGSSEICVQKEALPSTIYQCQPSPCAGLNEPTSCDCAAQLCGSFLQCARPGGHDQLLLSDLRVT